MSARDRKNNRLTPNYGKKLKPKPIKWTPQRLAHCQLNLFVQKASDSLSQEKNHMAIGAKSMTKAEAKFSIQKEIKTTKTFFFLNQTKAHRHTYCL